MKKCKKEKSLRIKKSIKEMKQESRSTRKKKYDIARLIQRFRRNKIN